MDFVLIDLYTQLDAVNAYTKGWDRPRILSWLRRFGRLAGPYSSFGEMWGSILLMALLQVFV